MGHHVPMDILSVVAEIELDGRTMSNAMDFYDKFFAATKGLLPDYGGRNLDALNDDLRELSEPLTIHWLSSAEAGESSGRLVRSLLRDSR